LKPDFEPKATDHISEMIEMIETLISNGFAYVSSGNVLFAVEKYNNYGALSGRSLDEMISGSRVEVAEYKKKKSWRLYFMETIIRKTSWMG
jgi:cysteinyl-tRNA synthetase